MLQALTGLPGSGKTLYLLSRILPEFKGRRVFVHGIPGIDHDRLGTEPLEDPENWFDLPSGAVIFMDEAQKVFPIRGQGKPVPAKCSAFEMHRHKGHDVVLLTQDGSLLDVHVRKLIEKHRHVYRLFGSESATIYEYPVYEPKPLSASAQKGALSKGSYLYDKKFYGAYKSADVHTVKRKIPKKLIVVLAFMGIAVGGIMWAGWYFMSGGLMQVDEPIGQEVAEEGIRAPAASVSKTKMGGIVESVEDYARLMTPLIEGVPHSAPFYQGVFQAVNFPRPNCMIIGDLGGPNECRCKTQQATTYDTSDELCRYYAVEGFYDPTKKSGANDAQRAKPAGTAPPAVEGQRVRPGANRRDPITQITALPASNRVDRAKFTAQPYYGYASD